MGIKILVCWDEDSEIEKAQKIRNWIDEALDEHDLHTGQRTVNDPPKSFGIIVPEKVKPRNA